MHTGQRGALRIVVADDHVVLRHGLRSIIEDEGHIIAGEACDGREAVRLCESLQPDIAILDVGMPLLNGIDAAREIKRTAPGVKIILLTMHADESYVTAGLRAGVSGYVLKTNATVDLVGAIKSVTNHEVYLSSGIPRIVVQAFLSPRPTFPELLSQREREVLQLIAEGLSMKEVGTMLGVSSRTAESHRARIMMKLNITEIAGLVRYAISHQLIDISADRPLHIEYSDTKQAAE